MALSGWAGEEVMSGLADSGHFCKRRAIDERKNLFAPQDLGDVWGGPRPTKGEALDLATVMFAQELCLCRRLDTLGNHFDVQGLGDSDDGLHDRTIRFVYQHVGNEYTRNLDAIGTEPLQISERRVPRAEIVDADADTLLPESH